MPALPPERPGCPKAPGGRRPLPDLAAIQLFLVPESAPPYDEDVPAGETDGGRLPAQPPHAGELWIRGDGRPLARPPHNGETWDRGEGWPVVQPPHAGGLWDRGDGRLPARPPRDAEPQSGGGDRPERQAQHAQPWSRDNGEPAAGPARDAARAPVAAPGKPATPPGAPPGWEDRFAQVLAETLAGSRPPHQIVPWTTEEAMRRIQRLGPRLASEQRPRVRRVFTSLPAPDVMEMTVVVGFGPRVKALAVRLEHTAARPAALPGRRSVPSGRSLPGARSSGERAAARWVCTAVEAA